MNIFYLKVELITLCLVLAYFYLALKYFNAGVNYKSKLVQFLAFWSIIMLYTNGERETLLTIVFLVLKSILIVLILIFFNKLQKNLKDKTDDFNYQTKKLTQAEIKILKLAYVDQISEIPNSIAFQKDFNDKSHLNDKRIVLLLNLDNFKYVNNVIGFTKGNEYLKEVAKLIIETTSYSDKVYSLGGDRFGIIHYGNECSASHLASSIIEKLNKSQDLLVNHCKMGASIGFSNTSFKHDYNKTMKEVELALLEVKNSVKNSYLCYNSKIDAIYENKLMIENKLERAINKKQFQMYFQPQVDIRSRKIVGVEALIRWIDDDGNFISPEEFIPLAEKTGKMNRISKFIMEESLRKLRSIIDNGYDDIKMSINVSAVEIFEDGFVDKFMGNIRKYSINPSRVNLEITETSLIENINLASSIFKELRTYDISISLDDFGVGYSSLNYFSKLPISEVKFDKCFTNDLLYSKKNEVILKHFTELSHT
ncbi:MAG: EAL domain-containing protein, partial [Acidaminobacteraceae bacterium]